MGYRVTARLSIALKAPCGRVLGKKKPALAAGRVNCAC
jgi:hypothetical protein